MKKIYFLRLITLAFLLMQNLSFAQNSRENPLVLSSHSKEKGWDFASEVQYSDTDDLCFAQPDYDDKDWKTISTASRENFKFNKVYWFRYYFKIDSTLINQPLNLDIRQLGASEIYLNGKKIEHLGVISEKGNSEFKIRKTSPTFVSFSTTENNVVAVRLKTVPKKFDSNFIQFTMGTLSISLKSTTEYLQDKGKLDKIVSYAIFLSGIFLALGFIHLLLFLFYKKALYNLYFSLYNFSISWTSYSIQKAFEVEDPFVIPKYQFWAFLGLLGFAFSLTSFVNELFGKRKIRKWFTMSFPIIALAGYWFSTDLGMRLLMFYIIFVGIESLIVIIKAILRKEKSAYIVGCGILFLFVYIVFQLIVSWLNVDSYLSGYNKNYVSLAVLISFPISISAYLAWQFASTNISLKKQLDEVNRLSEVNLQQEQEKQQILQNQNETLERQVNERTSELQIEKQKSEKLLRNILPEEVAEELKEKGSSEAKYYEEVSVLFTDFVSFTQNSEKMGAEKMLKELNDYFTAFDMIMEKHGLEKIKTIGDAYMAVCGLPHENKDHAYKTVLAALDIIEFIENRKITNPETLDIRIGVNSGSLVAGIVGVKKFAYDIWGDTVNTAARMEQNSQKGKVNISESTYQLVKDKINCEYRGKIDTKGKGEIDMYFALNVI